MRTVLIFSFLIVSASGFSQSKKVVNALLKEQLVSVQKTSDSIQALHSQKKREAQKLQFEIIELAKSSYDMKRKEDYTRDDIKYYHKALKEFNFDANTLVSLSELNLPSPGDKIQGIQYSELLTRSVLLNPIPEAKSIDEEKLKVQNVLLQQQIGDTKEVNEKNKSALTEEEKLISDLLELKKKYSDQISEQEIFKNNLVAKKNLLMDEYVKLDRKRFEEERIQYEKEQAALAKKNKNKKGKFVEPMIVDQEPDIDYPQQDVSGSNQKSNDDYDFERADPVVESAPHPEPPSIYDVVDVTAEFPGGQSAMVLFLQNNLKYPQTPMEAGLQGKCYLKFVVSESGNVSNVRVVKGVNNCPECDAEAVRVVRLMPDWKPGEINGKKVNCWFTLPISFKLSAK